MTLPTATPPRSISLWIFSQNQDIALRFSSRYKLVQNPKTPTGERPKAIVIEADADTNDSCATLIAQQRSTFPDVPILVLSNHTGRKTVSECLNAGANGYLLKSESTQRIGQALEELLLGGVPLSGAVARVILEAANLTSDPIDPTPYGLVEKDIDLLNCLSHGLTKKEIATRNGRSVHTIDNHFRRIYDKLSVNHLGGAIGKAFRAGVLR